MTHLFSDCDFTREVWRTKHYADGAGGSELLCWQAFEGILVEGGMEVRWMLQLLLFWIIWITRNETKHENKKINSNMVSR